MLEELLGAAFSDGCNLFKFVLIGEDVFGFDFLADDAEDEFALAGDVFEHPPGWEAGLSADFDAADGAGDDVAEAGVHLDFSVVGCAQGV